jgi:hypothetical protein
MNYLAKSNQVTSGSRNYSTGSLIKGEVKDSEGSAIQLEP